MLYRAYLPTRFMTVLEVRAESAVEAAELVKNGSAEFIRSDFVDFLLEELDESCFDPIEEDDNE